MSHLTKQEVFDVMTEISKLLKILKKSENVSTTRRASGGFNKKKELIFDIFLKFLKFYEISENLVKIEGSGTNLKCLLVSAKLLSEFFTNVFSKLPTSQINVDFPEYHLNRHRLTQTDVSLNATWHLVSDVARKRHLNQLEVKRSCQEQKAFRDSFLKTQTDFDIDFDDHEAEQETQLLSIEDAVLIIQKLERKYQAISRRNYVRFVRERAAELHGQKVEIDATQAAIRIQARTRGYFARKQVREMREKELNILNMTPESYIKCRLAHRMKEITDNEWKVQQIEDPPALWDIEGALEALRTDFFYAQPETLEFSAPKTLKIAVFPDVLFRDACFRGVISPQAIISMEELISQHEMCRISMNSQPFSFDLRTFLNISVTFPLSLSTWKPGKSQNPWLLISGPSESGKTVWTKGIAQAAQVALVHISKNVVNLGKRRIYTTVKKLAKHEKRLLISIDRIDVLRKDPKHKGYLHRQILLRNFLQDLRNTGATVIGMTKVPLDDLDRSILDVFQLQVTLSNPTNASRFDLAVDCLSRNMEQDRLPKIPNRLFDLEKQTNGFTMGQTSKFVTNRWSAANNKTNLS